MRYSQCSSQTILSGSHQCLVAMNRSRSSAVDTRPGKLFLSWKTESHDQSCLVLFEGPGHLAPRSNSSINSTTLARIIPKVVKRKSKVWDVISCAWPWWSRHLRFINLAVESERLRRDLLKTKQSVPIGLRQKVYHKHLSPIYALSMYQHQSSKRLACSTHCIDYT